MVKMRDIVYVQNNKKLAGKRCMVVGKGIAQNKGKFAVAPIKDNGDLIVKGDTWEIYTVPENDLTMEP